MNLAFGDTISLPSDVCPDYAQASGTCGTYSSWDPELVPNSTVNAAPNFYKALQGIFGVFPEYTTGGYNFATESYGGHVRIAHLVLVG